MKKLLLSFSAVLTLTANAQFVITATMAPVVGDVSSTVETMSTGLVMPTSGTNKFWNYTTVVMNPTATPNSTTYTPVSAAPNANLFPGATIASTSDNSNYDMLKNTSSLWESLGTAAPSVTDCLTYSNPLSLFSIPFAYGNIHNDTHAATTPQYTITGNTSTNANGSGTLAIPGYTFTNVLKTTISFTQNVLFTGGSFLMVGEIHDFFNQSSKFPLFSVDSFSQTFNGNTTVELSATINKSFVVGINENAQINSVNIYPNPATASEINFSNLNGNEYEIKIMNSLGQLVKEIKTSPVNSYKMNIESLKPGVYFVNLISGKSEAVKKLIVE